MTLRTDTEKQSSSEPESETSAPPIDLSAIAEKYPVNVRVMVLDMTKFDPQRITLLEVLDMSEAAGIDPSEYVSLLGTSSGGVGAFRVTGKHARLLYALGWIIARRAQPNLTFQEVCTWKMDIQGKMDPELLARNAQRAIATVSAAAALGITPAEAEQAEIGHIAAAKNRNKRRRR